MAEAYNRLSPSFRERLHGLKAIHSGHEQAAAARARDSVVRREPIATAHPLVRTHPATGEKALFVNQQFVRQIEGFKKEESDYLLKFLYDHVAFSQDLQCRVKWAPGTVVVWDNRVTAHTAILDWQDGQRRHLARLTPQAERPYEVSFFLCLIQGDLADFCRRLMRRLPSEWWEMNGEVMTGHQQVCCEALIRYEDCMFDCS